MSKEFKTTKELRSMIAEGRKTRAEGNEVGLVQGQDEAIFVKKDDFENTWKILRTKVNGCQASVMFVFTNELGAIVAGRKIAEAIGGQSYGTHDPRK